MKRIALIVCLVMGFIGWMSAQSSKSVSILGDSYSTFQGYLQPDT